VEGTIVETGTVRNDTELSQHEGEPDAVPEAAVQAPEAAPNASRPSQTFELNTSTLEVITDADDVQLPVTGQIRLTVHWPADTEPATFHCGDRIRALVRLLPPEIYHDPGVWSREDYLLDQGITSSAHLNVDRVESLGQTGNARTLLSCRIGTLQHATTQKLLALPEDMRRFPAPLRLTPDDAIMLAVMVAGDRTYLSHSLRVGLERTGSFHMLVVSGFQLAIVAGCIFWVARRLRLPRVPATFLTSEFLARVSPQWAVISCGLRNRYGHPRQAILEELQAAHVRTYRTDVDGATCFQLDGKAVTPDPACATNQIP
jgi:competence protein ComEC